MINIFWFVPIVAIASSPILVTLLPIVILARLSQLENALSLIAVTHFGNLTVFRFSKLLKLHVPIEVIPAIAISSQISIRQTDK